MIFTLSTARKPTEKREGRKGEEGESIDRSFGRIGPISPILLPSPCRSKTGGERKGEKKSSADFGSVVTLPIRKKKRRRKGCALSVPGENVAPHMKKEKKVKGRKETRLKNAPPAIYGR